MGNQQTCKVIEGERVRLRPIDFHGVNSDVQNVKLCASDPDVKDALRFFTFFQGPVSEGRQMEYFARMILSPNDQVFSVSTNGSKFLGTCGLHDIDNVNKNLRLGIIIFNKEYWRKGYGKEILNLLLKFAFESLGMNKVYLTARVDNDVGIHIYKKLGFEPEGVMRQEYWVREGQYIDLLRMSILKEGWNGKKEE